MSVTVTETVYPPAVLSSYVWASEPSAPCELVLNASVCPSPQSTLTCHGASPAPGSLNEPRSKLCEAPSSEL